MKPRRMLTVCSGIGAPELAASRLGWMTVAHAEIEEFPSRVLAKRFPGVPNLGDITRHETWDTEKCAADIVVGGTPCQSFSIAGLREGMGDARGKLTFSFVDILARLRPRQFVFENVPGLLSSNAGTDFAGFLGAVSGRQIYVPDGGWKSSGIIEGIPDAYGLAWTVLDAQYFGLAQRRKRVFVVGHLGGCWKNPAQVLSIAESMHWNPAPRREKRKTIAATIGTSPESSGCDGDKAISGTLSSRTKGGGGLGTDMDLAGGIVATLTKNYATHHGRQAGNNGGVAENQLIPVGIDGKPDLGYAIRADASHSGDKGDGGMNQTLVVTNPITTRPYADSSDGDTEKLIVQSLPEIVGCLSDGAHMGGGSTDKTPTPDESSLPEIAWAVQHRDAKGPDSSTKEGHLIVTKAGGFFDEPTPIQEIGKRQSGTLMNGTGHGNPGDPMYTLQKSVEHELQTRLAVRRLLPVECERLQGFPDDWTKLDDKTPDSPRYKAIGNSMAVPVLEWIFRRIDFVDSVVANQK